MKKRSILFSGPMVCAILENRKTQTWRVVKPQPNMNESYSHQYPPDGPRISYGYSGWYPDQMHKRAKHYGSMDHFLKSFPEDFSPYGNSGGRLWVKEATWLWCERRPNGITKTGRSKWHYVALPNTPAVYVADHPEKPVDAIPVTNSRGNRSMWKYKTARSMPRWASRITLEIVDVRVQRLQDIGEEDAVAEGIEHIQRGTHLWRNYSTRIDESDWLRSPTKSFQSLWDSINVKTHPWYSNPWIWAISFKKVA